VTPADFVMVHGDGWATGGEPLLTDTKESMLQRVTSKYYDVIDFDSVKAEMHGDIAITYGRPYDRRHRSGQAVVLGLVRAGVRKTRRQVDLSVASNGAWSDVRRGPAISARQVIQRSQIPPGTTGRLGE
jgi:hypothetical protein